MKNIQIIKLKIQITAIKLVILIKACHCNSYRHFMVLKNYNKTVTVVLYMYFEDVLLNTYSSLKCQHLGI